MITEKSVSVTEEKRIVTGLITSTRFIEEIKIILDLDYFTNSYLRTVATWSIAFFEEHKKAPYKHIQDIYESEIPRLKESDAELIGDLLKMLSEQYDPESVNVDYLKDCALDYFRKRELEIVVNNVSVLKEKGEYDEAEQEIERFNKVTLGIDSGVIINLGDINQISEIYKQREEDDKNFFQLPGDLGRYLGNHKRGDVVGYYAPAKRGKCVSENTLIYLSDGRLAPIKNVVHSNIKNILCMNEHQKIVKGEVIDWMYCGVKDEYEIKTKSGRTIRTSKDHKYFTPTGWKKLKDLTVKDRIALTVKIPSFSSKSLPSKNIRILAYLIADGHLGSEISFTKYDSEIMADFIQNLPESETYRIRENGTVIYLRRQKVYALIKKVGLLKKLSGDKFIPDCIMKSNNDTISEFLNILFTCDGSIWKDRNCVHIDYSSKSKLLIEQILYCLTRFGIFGKLREKSIDETTYYNIVLSSNRSILKFMKYVGFSFSKGEKAKRLIKNLIAKRDYIDCIPKEFVKQAGDELISKGISISRNETFRNAYRNNKHLSRYTFEKVMGRDHRILKTDILWDSIISIKKVGKAKMYDLSIKDHHNFIADSFVVHNSWTLVDNFKHAILSKRKTMFWSIEMTKTEITPRIMKAFEPMVDEEGEYPFPVFDCKKNQTGECKDRVSEVVILDGEELIEDPAHRPCTRCMRQGNPYGHEYEMTVYQDTIFRKQDDIWTVRKKIETMKSTLQKYGRLSVHPKYTLTYDKMMRDIEVVYVTDGFMPEIFIIDYIDILGIDSNFDDYRAVDEAWKLMAKIAGEFNALIITATQANKEGHQASVLDSTHQSGYYGKNQHVNLMVGINQTPEEKEQGIIRYGITEARSQHYIPGRTCTVLQDIKAGQAYLDSYYR